jgi:hypothetical protein
MTDKMPQGGRQLADVPAWLAEPAGMLGAALAT